MNIQNRTLLVTGANRGLGRAIVEEGLARGAARVFAGARDPRSLEPLRALGEGRVVPLRIDVTDDASLRAAATEIGELDVLVNNAGLLASFGALTSPLADIQRDLDTNFLGLLAATRAFLPALQRATAAGRPASLVNVLSVASLANVPALAGYSASKAAAFSITQALRAELATKGIRVHGVLAGAIDTDMVRAMDMPKTSPTDVARGLYDGLAEDLEDIAPDPMARELVRLWHGDPKAVERQLRG
jgi:NAD(P)-dependent dehydrogenase (short-subunit alcohol dehydrogenase family)